MTWFYVSFFEFFLLCAFGLLLYRKGIDNGKLQERSENSERMMKAQAEGWEKSQKRFDEHEQQINEIKKRNEGLNLALVGYHTLSELFKNPTRTDIPTGPEKVSELEGTRETLPNKL